MVNLQKLDTIAVIFMTIIGLIFFIMSISVFQNLDINCSSPMLRDGWAFIQALGASMIAAGISYFLCNWKGQCYGDSDNSRTHLVYFCIFGVFFLIIIGICAGMINEYQNLSSKKDCDDNNNTTKNSTIFVTIMSGICLIFCISIIIKTYIEHNKMESSLPSSTENQPPVKNEPNINFQPWQFRTN